MKPHRQIKTSNRVGDPSSKFAYNKNLDEVVNSKQLVIQSVQSIMFEEFEEMFLNKVTYVDESVMSQNQKFEIMRNALIQLKEKYDL